MRLRRSWWTCPACDTRIPIEVRTEARPGRLLRDPVTVSVHLGETALADVFAHVWTHTDRPEL